MAEGGFDLGTDEFDREEQQEEQNDYSDWDNGCNPNLDRRSQETLFTIGQGLDMVELKKKLLLAKMSNFQKLLKKRAMN